VALALVVEQRDRPAVLGVVGSQLVFQQVLLDLRLVVAGRVGGVDASDRIQPGPRGSGERLPILPSRQRHIEVMVGKEAAVVVRHRAK